MLANCIECHSELILRDFGRLFYCPQCKYETSPYIDHTRPTYEDELIRLMRIGKNKKWLRTGYQYTGIETKK